MRYLDGLDTGNRCSLRIGPYHIRLPYSYPILNYNNSLDLIYPLLSPGCCRTGIGDSRTISKIIRHDSKNSPDRDRPIRMNAASIAPEALSSLSEQRVLVVGVARNCEKTLTKDISRLRESLKSCKALSWLVVESDSSDGTVNALRVLERDVPAFQFMSLGSLKQTIPIRTQRIARCRNAYLEQLKSNPLYSDVDCVVVADLDGVNDLVTADGFASCWMRSEWGVCTANQKGPYYDIWALRHRLWSPTDCWRQYRFLVAHNAPKEAALWASTLTKMITIAETEEWIEVDSAFGGLGVYRRSVLDGVLYSGLDEDGQEICEHVSLNNQIKSRGARIFINPRLINSARTDHTSHRTFMKRLERYFGYAAKKLLIVGRRPASSKTA